MGNKEFYYTYSAPSETERKEIESIRAQYTEKTVVQETKLEKLRRLNRQVTSAATMIALILGVVGVLIFGGGMSLVLVKGIWIWGVLLGAVGAVVFGVAYPVYRWVFNRNKKKYGAEILQLSEELLRGDE
ncbi:MAG: hypothetical protein IJY05_01165 [Clostridia bacterium]|nr:hypothetical protein [Clostridia bacterium]